jgi:hypothetical protein
MKFFKTSAARTPAEPSPPAPAPKAPVRANDAMHRLDFADSVQVTEVLDTQAADLMHSFFRPTLPLDLR